MQLVSDINTFPVLLPCMLIVRARLISHHSPLYIPLSLPRPGATDSASSSSSSSSSFVNGATSKNLPAVQTVAPMPEDTMENMRSELSPPYSSQSLQPFSFLPLVPFSFFFWFFVPSVFSGACLFSTSFLSLHPSQRFLTRSSPTQSLQTIISLDHFVIESNRGCTFMLFLRLC